MHYKIYKKKIKNLKKSTQNTEYRSITKHFMTQLVSPWSNYWVNYLHLTELMALL